MTDSAVVIAAGLVCATALVITGHAAGVWVLAPVAALLRAVSWRP